jgi:hypothetical protein
MGALVVVVVHQAFIITEKVFIAPRKDPITDESSGWDAILGHNNHPIPRSGTFSTDPTARIPSRKIGDRNDSVHIPRRSSSVSLGSRSNRSSHHSQQISQTEGNNSVSNLNEPLSPTQNRSVSRKHRISSSDPLTSLGASSSDSQQSNPKRNSPKERNASFNPIDSQGAVWTLKGGITVTRAVRRLPQQTATTTRTTIIVQVVEPTQFRKVPPVIQRNEKS